MRFFDSFSNYLKDCSVVKLLLLPIICSICFISLPLRNLLFYEIRIFMLPIRQELLLQVFLCKTSKYQQQHTTINIPPVSTLHKCCTLPFFSSLRYFYKSISSFRFVKIYFRWKNKKKREKVRFSPLI